MEGLYGNKQYPFGSVNRNCAGIDFSIVQPRSRLFVFHELPVTTHESPRTEASDEDECRISRAACGGIHPFFRTLSHQQLSDSLIRNFRERDRLSSVAALSELRKRLRIAVVSDDGVVHSYCQYSAKSGICASWHATRAKWEGQAG